MSSPNAGREDARLTSPRVKRQFLGRLRIDASQLVRGDSVQYYAETEVLFITLGVEQMTPLPEGQRQHAAGRLE